MNPLPGTKLTDRLVPVRLPKRDAYVQLLTSPVREAQVVDRTGSGTYRSIQDVRASSHIMNTWFKQLCLLYLKSLPGRPHGNSCRTRNIWPGQIDLAHKPKGRLSAGSRGLGDSGLCARCQNTQQGKSKRNATFVSRQQFNLFSVWILCVFSAS